MSVAQVVAAVDQPFPGLRPFEASESLLFFGREGHTAELLRAIGTSHFIAVVGASGSGKSSLVRAGLLPALYRGYLVDATSHWRIAIMRPGNAPVPNLCRALSEADALGPASGERLDILSASSMGLAEVVRQADLSRHESLLIVVDQFEELFRYHREAQHDDGGSQAALFVSLLLQVIERLDNVYVVLTMRSDFLGECSHFTGLAEILSQSQFLIPRLTRNQRQDAIERPLRLAGAGISVRLVQQLLNDSADEMIVTPSLYRGSAPDPLPLLQHALMRMFQHWKNEGGRGELDLVHYQAVGRLQDALNQHAEAIYQALDASGKVVSEKLFRALTTTELGLPIRRPARLGRMYDIVGAETMQHQEAVKAVLRPFLDRTNSLLVSSRPQLDPETVLDIPHESLIWKWGSLQGWVRQEAASAALYVDLANNVNAYKQGTAALWRDPSLSHVFKLGAAEGWNQHWANQYQRDSPTFAETQDFLQESRRALRNERWKRHTAIALFVVAIGIIGLMFLRHRRAEENIRVVRAQLQQIEKEKAEAQSKVAEYQNELTRARANLTASLAKLSDEERAKAEKHIADIQQKLQISEEQARQLQLEQQRTTKLADKNPDVAAVNRTLEDRVNQLQTRITNVEKERQDAIDRSNMLQDSLDTATREIGRLKLQVEKAAVTSASSPRAVLTLRGHKNRVIAVAYSADGRYIATGSEDHTAKLWNAHNGQEIFTFRGHTAAIHRLSFSPDGRHLATSGVDHVAKLWDTKDGDGQDIRGHKNIVYCAVFDYSGRLLATGEADGAAVLWNVEAGLQGRTFRGHKGPVMGIAFSHDGKRLATASFDRTVNIWEVNSGKILKTLNQETAISDVVFGPDGKTLATATPLVQTVRVWDDAGNRLRTIGDATHMAFSADGSRFATGGKVSARVWDTATGKELLAIPINASSNTSVDVAFGPDTLRLVTSGGPDNSAVVWDVSSARR